MIFDYLILCYYINIILHYIILYFEGVCKLPSSWPPARVEGGFGAAVAPPISPGSAGSPGEFPEAQNHQKTLGIIRIIAIWALRKWTPKGIILISRAKFT